MNKLKKALVMVLALAMVLTCAMVTPRCRLREN